MHISMRLICTITFMNLIVHGVLTSNTSNATNTSEKYIQNDKSTHINIDSKNLKVIYINAIAIIALFLFAFTSTIIFVCYLHCCMKDNFENTETIQVNSSIQDNDNNMTAEVHEMIEISCRLKNL